MKSASPIRLGVSSCLLGQKVRYDGGHKRDAFLTDLLARFVEFVPVCPELELGLGVPRESIHLVRRDGEVRLVSVKTDKDLTQDMRRWAARRLESLEKQGLAGFIFKKDSPSCGLERVRVHGGAGVDKSGAGLFAAAVRERWPLLPVEEEGRLNDPRLRENFVERVFAHHRWSAFRETARKAGDLVRFHTDEKMLLMAHEPGGYPALGRLVAGAKGRFAAALADYGALFMKTLATPMTTRRHVNVLQHAVGYFRGVAGESERSELARCVEDYRRGLCPLIAPITLLRSLVRVHGIAYLAGQTYLHPHPKELMIRNHV
ncbi:MAG: DUF1722 domain-containing protein [Elusimicrobia bacterium]|nr:DUF1722 domain-containing protein [Elusimicrobiota bacterium]